MPQKKKRRSAHAVKMQKIRSKQSRKAKQKVQASHTYARPKCALQAHSVRGSSPLAAPFKIADKRVAKTAYVGLRDPKPAPVAGPAPNPDRACESGNSVREFESDSGSEVDSEGEPGELGREARAYTLDILTIHTEVISFTVCPTV
ncbi:hypothetical protein FIBSPDRAFT_969504 [Athelia psychrophila]|uniref:Uncharacterized protein n=1 Tax=Athelia psychrophila TaxID=1759441 RepID=A0A167TFW0_9AGAM|nr:hypothetical protein FIBSPDRAFT_969504 [Fibularhizoctonia sp. CBS 109695]